MTNSTTPYLCGGTFLCQVLRARNPLKNATEHTKSQKDGLSERETFRRLISIYQLSKFYGGTSLKPYTSQYKSCSSSLLKYTQFSDSDLRLNFDRAVKIGDLKILQMMSNFVKDFINVKEKGVQLVRSLLGTIRYDESILDTDEFYIEPGRMVTKKELISMNSFTVEYFLLGVWHYIIMNRADKNENGEDTYKLWYPSRGKYCGTVGNDIKQEIKVDSIPTILATSISQGDVMVIPSNATDVTKKLYSDSDEDLLREFTADYDELILKCIGSNFGEYMISENISKKIETLHSKWVSKADKFKSLSLKPSVWALLNHLKELSELLDENSTVSIGPGLHQIQNKLRNLYVKLHPDKYADSFLYDAIYDDWNLGEDY